MTNFTIVDSEKLPPVPKGWNTVENFTSKNKIVDEQKKIVSSDYNGRTCKVISKIARNHPLFARILRTSLGVLLTVSTLGIAYLCSKNVKRLFKKRAESITFGVKETFSWTRVAAQQGDVAAMRNVGIMYLQGNGVKYNYKEGIEWLRKAVKAEDPVAKFVLPTEVSNTSSQEIEVAAAKILETAAENGDSSAMVYLGMLCEKGTAAGGHTKAVDLFQKAAEMKNPRGMLFYQDALYDNGKCSPENLEKAKNLLLEAAKSSDPLGVTFLALYSLEGTLVEKDINKGMQLLQQASEMGYPHAKMALVQKLREGGIVERDPKRAAALLQEAADMGFCPALRLLGDAYKDGVDIAQDYAKAKELYETAAALGDKDAMFSLEEMYRKGLGVEQDQEKANAWMDRIIESSK